jgi:hypothetical protein
LFSLCLSINQQYGARTEEDRSFGNFGNSHVEKNNWYTVIPFLEQAAAIFREVGDKTSEARSCSTLSSIYTALRQPTQAQTFADRRDRILATGPSPLDKFKESDETTVLYTFCGMGAWFLVV